MPRDSVLAETPPRGDFAIPDEVALDEERDEEELQSLVRRSVEESLQWREEHLDPELEKATDYYKARPYGDEREGRSQVVTTELRDAVRSMLPPLLKTFTGSERVVEFKPRDDQEDVALSKQQTEYINYLFLEENDGFLILHSTAKDALVRKLGIMKWWWEEKEHVDASEHTGLTPADVQLLESDPYVEIETLQEDEASGTLDVRVLRKRTEGKPKVAAVPPEEFVWSPGARSLEDANMVGQWQEKSASDLIAMGVPKEMVERHKGKDTRQSTNRLKQARQIDEGARSLFEDEGDEAVRTVPFGEIYIRYDGDGDDVAEMHRVLCLGDACEIWEDELVEDHVPFAIFSPDPEPHTIVGLSTADATMDLQRIGSHVTRGMLDSLTAHINPATEVVDSEVNMKDVLNQEIGRVVRVRRPGMMREIPTEFVGASCLPVLEHLENVKENRIGVTAASAGLDPDALQSTTATAVNATVTAAQQQLEMTAKLLAETGMKRLFKGLLRLVVQHQDQPAVVRLRNEWVKVDPRSWDAEKDVVVNVALGTGLVEDKLQTLGLIAQKQEEHLQQGSPLVGFEQIRATYARMIELLGYRNVGEFFRPFGEQEAQAFAQAQAQNQKPSDTEVLEKIEMAKIQARSQEKQAEMQLKIAELQLQRATEARKLGIEEAKVDAKTRIDLTDQAIKQAQLSIEAQSAEVDALKKLSETRVGE